jgi:hypothetical protein
MAERVLYGVCAEFRDPAALLAAARACHRRFRHVEAYAPYAVEGLAEAVGFTRNRVPLLTLLGGIAGGVGAYFLQWYTAVIDYPIDVGGRSLHSWPAFVPATFELTILGAALAAFFGFIVLNGLPRLNHPMFDAPQFDLASTNRFFVVVRAGRPGFSRDAVRCFLASLDPLEVVDVIAEQE